jgi:predicted transcriptional regulator of viral defense system
MKNKNIKTLGRKSARLIARLYELGKVVFTIKDVVEITELNYFSAGRFISELKQRKIISTLKKGKHIIIPQELGSIDSFIGNWYVVAREITNSPHYYVAFYSAMKYWGMTTHPIVKMFISTPKRQFPPKTLDDKVIFIYINKKNIWGVKNEWVTRTERVNMSDIEKTIIDALAHPRYCGGITEIAKGIWLAKDKIDLNQLLKYLRKYDKHVVAKRLGYILEILDIGGTRIAKELRKYVKTRYDLFDPTAEEKVVDKNSWRLVDNIGKEQIQKIIST